jgi:hypothetical protein
LFYGAEFLGKFRFIITIIVMVFVSLELRLIKKQHKAWCEKYYEEARQASVG